MHLTSCSALIVNHLPLIIDTIFRSSLLHPPDHPDFRHTVWANFQACLEDDIPINPHLHNKLAFNMYFENLIDAVMETLAASIPKSCPHDDPLFPIQRSVTCQLNVWRNDWWSVTTESFDPEDQTLWSTTRWVMRVPVQSSCHSPGD
jgi:hypothetical protein